MSFSFRRPSSSSSPKALTPPPPVDPNYPMREPPSLNRMVVNSTASPKQAPGLNPPVSKYMSLRYFNSSVIA